MVIPYRRPIGPICKGQEIPSSWISWPLKLGPIGCPETSVRNYHHTLRKITEERRSKRPILLCWNGENCEFIWRCVTSQLTVSCPFWKCCAVCHIPKADCFVLEGLFVETPRGNVQDTVGHTDSTRDLLGAALSWETAALTVAICLPRSAHIACRGRSAACSSLLSRSS